MAPRHPPRFVVRSLDDAAHERRRRLVIAAAWLLSLLLVGAGVWLAASRVPLPGGARVSVRQVQADNEDLRQQVANLQRSAQVADVAAKELKRNLAERDEEISGLRTDLAFYSRLVGGGAQRDGLKIQGARTSPVNGAANAWNVVVTLTQNARRGEVVKGTLRIAVEGIQGNAVTTLEGAALGQGDSSDGLPFSFKYFQQIQGSFTLPAGFRPTRLRLTADVTGDPAVTGTLSWGDTQRNDEATNVQQ
ncbi:hypothetical protein SAMN02800692_0602 [Luteibacter sp. UNC138MFCol5.1]|uniref:DUF6776 family protein n=1 Tax=Luteibacter sp. UNC138MFCol5.1 TaxID=1502774 RepID=UPI0008D5E32F|nr:DUF6776 family protein [Luteibacter sp. UNC138MFCol5.1]SEO39950.1 hypothetical protein SAMN02800692_0602 [Luteibacter sp. UNC138MFCol5.1]